MAFTYDTGTTTGQVRMLIQDVDLTQTTGARSTWTAIFTDGEIDQFLTFTSANVYRAAAMALRAVAANRALLAKRITAGPYTEDATQVARQLRDLAKDYDEQANQMDLYEGEGEVLQEIPWTNFALYQIIENEDRATGA